MKRLFLVLVVVLTSVFAYSAFAGDYHVGLTLQCTDCHIMHASQSHAYPWLGTQPLAPTGTPHEYLLRSDPNNTCLGCHNGNTAIPDVLGGSADGGNTRQGGALNVVPGAGRPANDAGFEVTDGHSLWSTDVAPGGTFSNPEGLECVNCHAQHGIASQYRNLLNRGSFGGKNVTYATSTNNTTKDVFQRAARAYEIADVDFNEPNQTKSAYADWCKTCHTNFHGLSGGAEVGGISGGNSNPAIVSGWVRHPNADVNIGTDPGTSGTVPVPADSSSFISSYVSRYYTRVNRVKVMAPNNDWLPDPAGARVLTPSCFSCHKAHGNRNGFGLIFMNGTTGAPAATEDGDGGAYIDLCRQCHAQGSYGATGSTYPNNP